MGNLLLKENAKLIGQGITGFEGSRALPKMLEFGTQIVAGVTPGKGGQTLEDIPIFNSVQEVLDKIGPVDGSVIFAPPLRVLDAVKEALDEGIKFLLIGAEKVPTKDEAEIYALAKKYHASVIGPNSVGLINPSRRLKLGLLSVARTEKAFIPGEIAIISKSGSMTAEIGLHLKTNNLGISWAVGIGGDIIPGTDFADFLLELENDSQTKASVIFGELGGTLEEGVAKLKKEGRIQKPVIAFIAGDFTKNLPKQVQFGHAGAIIEGDRGLPEKKRQILSDSGVLVAKSLDDIASLVKECLTKENSKL